jgi:polynucleotide 5'-kinase involved in rRNA processing
MYVTTAEMWMTSLVSYRGEFSEISTDLKRTSALITRRPAITIKAAVLGDQGSGKSELLQTLNNRPVTSGNSFVLSVYPDQL